MQGMEVNNISIVDGHENEATTNEGRNFQRVVQGRQEVMNIEEDRQPNVATESQASNVFESPGGTKTWFPDVPDEFKPVVGKEYGLLKDCILMYEKYAELGGFDIRASTTRRNKYGVVTVKYFLCNKFGKSHKKSINTASGKGKVRMKRNSNYKVTDCKACVKFHIGEGTSSYFVYDFVEGHNHRLLEDGEKNFTRKRRQLDFSDKILIHRASSTNIGATKAHKLQASLKGGYENIDSTKTDFKNFARDYKCLIGEGDCDVIVETLTNRKEHGTSFEYNLEKNVLTSLFWADNLAKFNYSEFGDVISFDATYRTNKYAMIFVPFTAVDNHKHSVVVGAGLLSDETYESYAWLLEVFLKVHGRQPHIVLTDEDASMKEAIADFFPDARHRLGMWHIMDKVPTKVSGDVYKNTDFRDRLTKIVWNVNLTSEEFESRWNELIVEYNLQDNGWLSKKFEIRQKWIPAYFNDVYMCGLMKTTSRSESINSFFNTYGNNKNSLVNFMFSFDMAMDKQIHRQRTQAHESNTTRPKLKTETDIEQHASMVYTRTIFFEFQKELEEAAWACNQWNVVEEDQCQIFTIRQKVKSAKNFLEFKVRHSEADGSFTCECNHYHYYGLLCRHVLNVLMTLDYEKIPEQYIARRWKRDLLPMDVFNSRVKHFGRTERAENLSREILSEMNQCLNEQWNDDDMLESILEQVRVIRENARKAAPQGAESSTKKDIIKDLLGVSPPDNVQIQPPKGIRNKGCGTGKRLIGPGEKAKTAKPPRLCRACGEYGNHDSRNCLNKKKKQQESDKSQQE